MKQRKIKINEVLISPINGKPIVDKDESPITLRLMLISAVSNASAMGEEDSIRVVLLAQELYRMGAEVEHWLLKDVDFRLLKLCLQQSAPRYTLPAFAALTTALNESEEVDG